MVVESLEERRNRLVDGCIPLRRKSPSSSNDNTRDYGQNSPVYIGPSALPSSLRERMSFSNKRRYDEINRNAYPYEERHQNKVTKLQTQGGEVDVIDLLSSDSDSDSDSDNNNFESSNRDIYSPSSSSSTEYDSDSDYIATMPRMHKKCTKHQSYTISIDSDSDTDSCADGGKEVVISTEKDLVDDGKASKVETTDLNIEIPVSNVNVRSVDSNVSVSPLKQNSDNVNCGSNSSCSGVVNGGVVKRVGFETLNIKGRVIQKPIDLRPNRNNNSAVVRSASEQQVPLQKPLLEKPSTVSLPLLTSENPPSTNQGEYQQQQQQQQQLYDQNNYHNNLYPDNNIN